MGSRGSGSGERGSREAEKGRGTCVIESPRCRCEVPRQMRGSRGRGSRGERRRSLLSTRLLSLAPSLLLVTSGQGGKVSVKCRFQCVAARIGQPPAARSVNQPRLRGIPPYKYHQVVAGLHYWAPKWHLSGRVRHSGGGQRDIGGSQKGAAPRQNAAITGDTHTNTHVWSACGFATPAAIVDRHVGCRSHPRSLEPPSPSLPLYLLSPYWSSVPAVLAAL